MTCHTYTVAVSTAPAQLPTNFCHQPPPTALPPPALEIEPPGPPVILPLLTCEVGYRFLRNPAAVDARNTVPQPHIAPLSIGKKTYDELYSCRVWIQARRCAKATRESQGRRFALEQGYDRGNALDLAASHM